MIERIVVINDSSVAKGGATGLALASAFAFRAAGYPVTFLTGDTGENDALKAAGVEIVALGQARLLASPIHKVIAGALFNDQAEKFVSGWIRQFDTPNTIFHLHGWAQIFSPSIFVPLKSVVNRLILTAHDFFLVCPNGSYSFLKTGRVCDLAPQSVACIAANCDRRSYGHKLWRVARQSVRRLSIDLDDFTPQVLAIHESMRPFLERGGVPARAIRTVPNPVRPFLPARVAAKANHEFVFIGRLESGKGPDLACAAARQAGVPLRLIGDGPMGDQLRQQYPEVSFSGRLPPEQIAPLVAEARALLMPSRYPEPYGLVAAEALWSGIPVIAADTAFLTADIVARGAGLSCVPRDVDQFSGAIKLIATDDELAHTMSVSAFEGTRDLGMTYEAWTQALLAVFEQQLAACS